MSYESSLASAWESYSDDAYTEEVDIDDPCEDCGQPAPKGMMAVAELDASSGYARWVCPNCQAEMGWRVNWGYDDVAESRKYNWL